MAKPITYRAHLRDPSALILGLEKPPCINIRFSHRAYELREKDARDDYDRLLVSIFHNGIKAPVITWGDHVIIGMRRTEIAQRMGIKRIAVAEIDEDVTRWWRHDLPRLDRLKRELGEIKY